MRLKLSRYLGSLPFVVVPLVSCYDWHNEQIFLFFLHGGSDSPIPDSEYHVPALEVDNAIINNGVVHVESSRPEVAAAARDVSQLFAGKANRLPSTLTLVGQEAGWISGPQIKIHPSASTAAADAAASAGSLGNGSTVFRQVSSLIFPSTSFI